MYVATVLFILILNSVPNLGNWEFQLKLKSYTNTDHIRYLPGQGYACCDCPASGTCFSENLNDFTDRCTDRDCNNMFLICVSDNTARPNRCIYSETINDDDIITFGNGLTVGGLNNPLVFGGITEGPLTISISIFDDPTNSRSDHVLIDEIVIANIAIDATEDFSSVITRNGERVATVTMELSYKFQCAEGYSGNMCNIEVQPSCTVTETANSASAVGPVVASADERAASVTTPACTNVATDGASPVTSSCVSSTQFINSSEIASLVINAVSEMACDGQVEQQKDDMDTDDADDADALIIVFLTLILIISLITAIVTIAVLVCQVTSKPSKQNSASNAYDLK